MLCHPPQGKSGGVLAVVLVVDLGTKHPRIDGFVIPLPVMPAPAPVLHDQFGAAPKPDPRVHPGHAVRYGRHGSAVVCLAAVPVLLPQAIKLRIEALTPLEQCVRVAAVTVHVLVAFPRGQAAPDRARGGLPALLVAIWVANPFTQAIAPPNTATAILLDVGLWKELLGRVVNHIVVMVHSDHHRVVFVGLGAGLTIPRTISSFILAQIEATLQPLSWSLAGFDLLIILVGVVSVLVYFFFSLEHNGAVGKVSRLGIAFLMISFGASFGYTIMARLSLLIGRISFLMDDWLHLL